MKTATVLGVLVLLTPGLLADSHHVEVDAKADFSAFKTFVIRDGRATSRSAEINNTILLAKIQDAIRNGLSTVGLKESPNQANQADLVVTFSVGEQGRRGTVGRGIRDMRVVTTSEGTLVIEMRNGTNVVWHGTYTDDEANPAKLARRLPDDAKKLLRELPPAKKK
jgi:Domain of unknown function (DUF4136)